MSDVTGLAGTDRFYSLSRPALADRQAAGPAAARDIWTPGNKGVLIQGSQKETREQLSLPKVQPGSLSAGEKAELDKACKEFESFFTYYMLKNMDKTVIRSDNSPGNSRAMQFYREMLYERIADSSSEKGVGLSQSMSTQMQQFLINNTYK